MMTLPNERLKDWIILPSILPQSRKTEVDATVVMNSSNAEQYEEGGKLKLPNLATRQGIKMLPFETSSTNDATVQWRNAMHLRHQKKRRNITNRKGYCRANNDAYEFVNIVNNPPTTLKFLSTTDVRISHQTKSATCGRCNGNFMKSDMAGIDGQDNKEQCLKSSNLRHFNSEDNDLFDDCGSSEISSCEETSLGSVELDLLENTNMDDRSKAQNGEDQEEHFFNQEDFLQLLSAMDQEEVNDEGDERYFEQPCKVQTKHAMGAYLDNYEYLITRQIELEKRKVKSNKAQQQQQQHSSEKQRGQYHMEINVQEAHHANEASNNVGTKKRLAIYKPPVCERCETKCKSRLDSRRSASNEEMLTRTSTVRVYPFYEESWSNEGNDACSTMCIRLTTAPGVRNDMPMLNDKANLHEGVKDRVCDSGKCELSVSKIKLTNKNLDAEEKRGLQEKIIGNSIDYPRKEMAKNGDKDRARYSGDNAAKQDVAKKDYTSDNHSFDANECRPVNQQFLQSESYLLRLVENTQRLTDNEFIRLIQQGRVDFQKYLILKELLSPLYQKEWYKKGPKESSAPHSRVGKLVEFFKRIERLCAQLSDAQGNQDWTSTNIVSDLVIFGFNTVGSFETHSEVKKKAGKRGKKKKKNCFQKFNQFSNKHQDNCDEHEKKLQKARKSLQKSMFVGAVSLAEQKQSKKLYFNEQRNIAKNASFHQSIAGTGYKLKSLKGKQKHKDEAIFIANPPSSRNSFLSSLESISTMLGTQASPKKLSTKDNWMYGADVNETLEPLESSPVLNLANDRLQCGSESDFLLRQRVKHLLKILASKNLCTSDMHAIKDTKIDYSAHFTLVNMSKLEIYCTAFAKVDHEDEAEIPIEGVYQAVTFVDSLVSVPKKYIDYTLQILDMWLTSITTIKMFCVVCCILERMVDGGVLISNAMDSLCLMTSQGKMIWYKNMFHEAVTFDKNFISLETVRLELFAGGMDENEEREVSDRITTEDRRISFVDFIAYIPLFISIHEKICSNAFNLK
eukprot:gene7120-7924_t